MLADRGVYCIFSLPMGVGKKKSSGNHRVPLSRGGGGAEPL